MVIAPVLPVVAHIVAVILPIVAAVVTLVLPIFADLTWIAVRKLRRSLAASSAAIAGASISKSAIAGASATNATVSSQSIVELISTFGRGQLPRRRSAVAKTGQRRRAILDSISDPDSRRRAGS
jgi:hypothetical protein